MRASPILVVLMLMIAPPSARGQHAQQDALPPLERVCSVPADERWTPQEKFVWERVCVGEVANFNEAPGFGGKLDPMNAADWPPSRILRPAFLEAILLNDPYRRALTRFGVIVVGARFVETIDLVGADLQHPLALDVSLVEKVAGTVKLSALMASSPPSTSPALTSAGRPLWAV
jgi:hypothetical protein